jgi:glycosyltransferase involved in cell wall biosynthesis
MKKIALVTDQLSIGGGLEHIYQIAKQLSTFSFGIFGKKGDAVRKFKELTNVRIFDEGYHLPYLSIFEPDIIHVHHLKPLMSLYSMPFISPHKPVLFTLHGAHIHKYEFLKGAKHRLEYPLRFYLEKYLLNRIDQLITDSSDDLQFIQKTYKLSQGIYIPNGLDMSGYTGQKARKKSIIRKKLEFPPDSFLFLMVARYDYAKGYDVLIQAVNQLKNSDQLNNFKFVLIGRGPEKSVIEKLISNYALQNAFILIDRVDTIEDIMTGCDFLIVPSRWEGLPYILLEAAQYHIPVLASNTYGIRGVIKHQKNGLLFENQSAADLAEKILEITSGKYNVKKLSEALYHEVKDKYDIKSSMKELENLYYQWLQSDN